MAFNKVKENEMIYQCPKEKKKKYYFLAVHNKRKKDINFQRIFYF